MRRTDTAGPELDAGLGRVIARKWWFGWDGAMSILIYPILALFPLVILQILLDSAERRGEVSEFAKMVIQAGFVAVLGSLWIFLFYRNVVKGFCIHERGVVKRGLFRTIELHDAEIGGLGYQAVDYRGQGLLIEMVLVTLNNRNKREIRFRALYQFISWADELRTFRDRVAKRLAQQMLDSVQRVGECNWCRLLVLTQEGLRIGSNKVFVHFADVAAMDLDQGRCVVWRRSTRKPAGVVDLGEYNCWPAYHAIKSLIASQ